MTNGSGNIQIYQSDDGQTQIDVRFQQDTIWLSQAQMAELFKKDTNTIGLHLKNIYESRELEQQATTEESWVVRQENKGAVKRKIRFYNLDAIISVGYRVNSITVVPEYVLVYLKSPSLIQGGISKMTGTAGQKRVTRDYFAGNHFPLSSLEEQKRIVAKVDQLMTLCDQLEAKLKQETQTISEKFVAATVKSLVAA